jgi:hypothetical protein
VGDVRIDDSVLATLAEPRNRGDRRLAKSAVLGAVGAAITALRSGSRQDIEAVARPWDVEGLVEASARLSALTIDDVVVVEVRADAEPLTLVARLGDESHLALRGAGEQETSAWRAVLVTDPGSPVPAIHPEATFTFPLPAVGAEELRWICLALEDISEALDDRIYTMPGRPMSDETEDLGQGETRRVQRLAWHVGPHGFLEATTALHEIYDGATPTWTHLHGLLMGLADDSACLLNATVRANEETVVTVLLSAPRARLDRAMEQLTNSAGRPGDRAL